MDKRRPVVSHDDWSLHRKGHIDQQRHREKVREAIRENLADLVAEESIIMSDGDTVIKVPIRSLEEYRFRYDPGDGSHVGQGDGDSQVGDVIGHVRGRGAVTAAGPAMSPASTTTKPTYRRRTGRAHLRGPRLAQLGAQVQTRAGSGCVRVQRRPSARHHVQHRPPPHAHRGHQAGAVGRRRPGDGRPRPDRRGIRAWTRCRCPCPTDTEAPAKATKDGNVRPVITKDDLRFRTWEENPARRPTRSS